MKTNNITLVTNNRLLIIGLIIGVVLAIPYSLSAQISAKAALSDLSGKVILVYSPAIESAVNNYAMWKKQMGYEVEVIPNTYRTSASEVNTSRENLSYDIKSAIVSNKRNFIVMLGDTSLIPTYTILSPSTLGAYANLPYVSDMPYISRLITNSNGQLERVYEDNTWIGRIPLESSLSDVYEVIYKIKEYEKSTKADDAFYNTVVHCAYFQDDNKDGVEDNGYYFLNHSEGIKNYLQTQGKTVKRIYSTNSTVNPSSFAYNFNGATAFPSELKSYSFDWKGNADKIASAINSGALIVDYFGHGGVDCWGNPSFTTSDCKKLSNDGKWPLLLSLTCNTGTMASIASQSFVKSLLSKSTNGAIAMFGCTGISYSNYDEVVRAGVIDAIYPSASSVTDLLNYLAPSLCSYLTHEKKYTLGEILDHGKEWNKTLYGANNDMVNFLNAIYHCYGDPSMEFYASKPSVISNVSYTVDASSSKVTVSLPSNLRNSNSLVSILDMTVANNLAQPQARLGDESAVFNLTAGHEYLLCVRSHGMTPYFADFKIPITVTIPNSVIEQDKTVKGDAVTVPNGITVKDGTLTIISDDVTIKSNTTVSQSGRLIINSEE